MQAVVKLLSGTPVIAVAAAICRGLLCQALQQSWRRPAGVCRLKQIVAKIDDFDQVCQDGEHTDTGDVWDVLNEVRDLAYRALYKAVPR